MCNCIAERNNQLKDRNARIILYNNGKVIVPSVATEKINKSITERIPLLPVEYCPFCGDKIT
jgi:hypothetical protein